MVFVTMLVNRDVNGLLAALIFFMIGLGSTTVANISHSTTD